MQHPVKTPCKKQPHPYIVPPRKSTADNPSLDHEPLCDAYNLCKVREKPYTPDFSMTPHPSGACNHPKPSNNPRPDNPPIFSCENLHSDKDGKSFKLSSLRGKYVLVDFWASWCGPCMREMPNVVKLYKECKGKNFEIVGVSLDQKRDAWLNAVEKNKMKWIQVSDLKSWATLPVKLCNVSAVPYTVLIDPQGKVIALNLRGEELINKVKEVLNKK